jgi:hypothetical protein
LTIGKPSRAIKALFLTLRFLLTQTLLTHLVTWGTNPGQGVSLLDRVPNPADFADANERALA